MSLLKELASGLWQLVSGLRQLINVLRMVVSDLVNSLSRLSADQVL